jgi:hypothetical protein
MPPKDTARGAGAQSALGFTAAPLYKAQMNSYCILSGAELSMDAEFGGRQFVFQVIGGEGDSKKTTMLRIKYTRRYIADDDYVHEVEAAADAEIYEMSKLQVTPRRSSPSATNDVPLSHSLLLLASHPNPTTENATQLAIMERAFLAYATFITALNDRDAAARLRVAEEGGGPVDVADLEARLRTPPPYNFDVKTEFKRVVNPDHVSGDFMSDSTSGVYNKRTYMYSPGGKDAPGSDKFTVNEYSGKGGIFSTGQLHVKLDPRRRGKTPNLTIEARWPFIARLLGKSGRNVDSDDVGVFFTKEEDLPHQVRHMQTIVNGQLPLSLGDSASFKKYVFGLEPKHRVPSYKRRLRILRKIVTLQNAEAKRIIADRRRLLRVGFLATASDMWDSHYKGSFAALLVTLLAKSYRVRDGSRHGSIIFMSDETATANQDIIICSTGLKMMEFAVSFQKFDDTHTGANIAAWMKKSLDALGVRPLDQRHACTDGAGNAKKSVSEYRELEDIAPSVLRSGVCLPHQFHRAFLGASGLGYKMSLNAEMKIILKRLTAMAVSIMRSYHRTQVLHAKQKSQNRKPLSLLTGVATRWEEVIKMVERMNIVEADLSAAIATLNAEHLLPYDSGEEDEEIKVPRYELSVNTKEEMLQMEGAAAALRHATKVSQASKNVTIHDQLLCIMSVKEHANAKVFQGPSASPLREDRPFVTYEEPPLTDNQHSPVTPSVSKFRQLLVKEINERFGLTDESGNPEPELPYDLIAGLLLDPTKHNLTGILTTTQGEIGKGEILTELASIARGIRNDVGGPAGPPSGSKRAHDDDEYLSDDSCDYSDNDGSSVRATDPDFTRAKAEYDKLLSIKQHKYAPKKVGGFKVGVLMLGGKLEGRRQSFEVNGHDGECNLADYTDTTTGTFDIVKFYHDLSDAFPLLWILVQRLACVVGTEAGAERFFNTAGYTLRPERSLIRTDTYERLVIGKVNASAVFVRTEAIVASYMKADRDKSWNAEADTDDQLFVDYEGLQESDDEGAREE